MAAKSHKAASTSRSRSSTPKLAPMTTYVKLNQNPADLFKKSK